MHEITQAFLESISNRAATSSDYARAEEIALLAKLGDGLKECFDLTLAMDDVELLEDDKAIRSQLGEYSQKLGAFTRVGQELRAKIQELARIRREINEVEERVGAPLRAGAAESKVTP